MSVATAEPAVRPVTTVTIGVDTHSQLHHAAVLDQHGQLLGDRQFTTDIAGYQELLDWAASYGIINAAGVECTGSYGAGLTRHLLAAGIDVVEVNRGHRLTRSRSGKNDAIDAEAAARKVMSGECSSPAKDTTGAVEAIRNLHLLRDSAVKSRAAALVQLRDVLVTAPTGMRERFDARTLEGKATQARALRPDSSRLDDPSVEGA
ncbi:transposase [Citricoccus nitrophenolicus]